MYMYTNMKISMTVYVYCVHTRTYTHNINTYTYTYMCTDTAESARQPIDKLLDVGVGFGGQGCRGEAQLHLELEAITSRVEIDL